MVNNDELLYWFIDKFWWINLLIHRLLMKHTCFIRRHWLTIYAINRGNVQRTSHPSFLNTFFEFIYEHTLFMLLFCFVLVHYCVGCTSLWISTSSQTPLWRNITIGKCINASYKYRVFERHYFIVATLSSWCPFWWSIK